MAKNLLIVESPAKAKTIEKYLGKDFKVKSSYGHIRDLKKGSDGIDIENGFNPTYEISPEKTKVVAELKKLVKDVDEVWLATDEDREGEAISWHLCKVLGLDEHTTKRIVFREITSPAIKKAITQPRTVDLNLVNAQQARRVLDRLVGFELSELLWKKVKGKLSAGRVQSVAVKLVVDREREIMDFASAPFFKLTTDFTVPNTQGGNAILKAELPRRIDTYPEAQTFVKSCVKSNYTISDIQVKPMKKKPAAPFTTSTLQQEASRKLGFSVTRTMSNAQRLYEAGHITYMRTDSTNLSDTALAAIAKTIEDDFGLEYVKTRKYKSNKDSQEAHEAIRPTYAEKANVASDRDQQRLYDLIRKRAIASQMAQAEFEKTTAKIDISGVPADNLVATGEVLKFEGFLKVYLESKDDEDEDEENSEVKGILPPLNVGQVLTFSEMMVRERFTRASPRYAEASLVKKLEELGIGRPSTYAPTISKITEPSRGYVTKETREGTPRDYRIITLNKSNQIAETVGTETTGNEKNKLFPTDLGMIVVDFLSEHFKQIMDYSFTAKIEKQFDHIADGAEEWSTMMKDFYFPFHDKVKETTENADRANGERKLGVDEATGLTVLVRMSRFGPVAQIGSQDDEIPEDATPKYANLKPDQSLETITFEEVKELFKFPKNLGDYRGKEVIIGQGRFGPYVKFDEKFVSIPRVEDPHQVTMQRAIELILEKEKEDAPIGTYQELPITRGKGRFGPFLKWKDLFVNIPKRFDPEALTQTEIFELLEAKIEKEANRYVQRWEDIGLSIQNGRWGPFIKLGKLNFKLPKDKEGNKMTNEVAALLTLDEVKAIVEAESPDAFKKPVKKKRAASAKKGTTKKAAAKATPIVKKISISSKFKK